MRESYGPPEINLDELEDGFRPWSDLLPPQHIVILCDEPIEDASTYRHCIRARGHNGGCI